jgi:hypothetical protein
MPSVRICTTVDHDATAVWGKIADYNNWYTWLREVADSRMESSAAPGPVGAVRRVGDWDNPRVREVLLAHDDSRMTLSYGVAEEPVWQLARHYVATVQVLALTEQPGCVLDWSSRFDCDQADEAAAVERLSGLYRSFVEGLEISLLAASRV